MRRKPRPEKEPILSNALLLWLAVLGIVLGGTALGVIWWAHDAHDTAVARTMGMTTFAIANVFLSFAVKDDLASIFSSETLADRRLLKATGLSAIAIVFGTGVGIFQRILGTVSLTGREWLICIVAALTVVVVSELQKAVRRRRLATEPASAGVEEFPENVDEAAAA
jgi:Ca2+-transporting ATPase